MQVLKPKITIDSKVKQIVDKSNYPVCPICNSKVYMQKNGKNAYGDIRFKCRKCNHRIVPYVKPKFLRKRVYGNNSMFLAKPEIVFVPHVNQTGKNIVDVPCFCCPEGNRGCNPCTCTKLEKWLMVNYKLD